MTSDSKSIHELLNDILWKVGIVRAACASHDMQQDEDICSAAIACVHEIKKCLESEWSVEWPTEPGYYWFYGRRYDFFEHGNPVEHRQAPIAVSMIYAEKRHDQIFVTLGFDMPMKKEYGAKGIFKKIEKPDSPTVEMQKMLDMILFFERDDK